MELDNQLRRSAEALSGSNTYSGCSFLGPAEIVAFSALAEKRGCDQAFLAGIHEDVAGYLQTIGVYESLWGIVDTRQRPNKGISYATLAKLGSLEAVDGANDQLKSCINSNLPPDIPPFSKTALNHVIGELHDNVWSHGRSTGFSMAQFYKRKQCIEFAVADLGGGFLTVLQRAAVNAQTHEDAIRWCLQEGNSSVKEQQKRNPVDDFAQSLPADYIGNPMGGAARYRNENNHQGFGLAELMKLVRNHHGELEIASGDTLYTIDKTGRENYRKQGSWEWQGVIISCRLYLEGLRETPEHTENNEVNQILNIISGGFDYGE